MFLRQFTIILVLEFLCAFDSIDIASRAYYHNIPKLEQEQIEIQSIIDSEAITPHLSLIQDKEDKIEYVESNILYSKVLSEEANQVAKNNLEMTFALFGQAKLVAEEFNHLKKLIFEAPAKINETVKLINTAIKFDFDGHSALKQGVKFHQQFSDQIKEQIHIQAELTEQVFIFRRLNSEKAELEYKIQLYASIINYLVEIGAPKEEKEYFSELREEGEQRLVLLDLELIKVTGKISRTKVDIDSHCFKLLNLNLKAFKSYMLGLKPLFEVVLKKDFERISNRITADLSKETRDLREVGDLNQEINFSSQAILLYQLTEINQEDTHLVEIYTEAVKKVKRKLFQLERKGVCSTFGIQELKRKMLYALENLTGEPAFKMKHLRQLFSAVSHASFFLCNTWDFGIRIMFASSLTKLSFNFEDKMEELIQIKELKQEENWEEILENASEETEKYWKLKLKMQERGKSINLLVKSRKFTFSNGFFIAIGICFCSILVSIVLNSRKLAAEQRKQALEKQKRSF